MRSCWSSLALLLTLTCVIEGQRNKPPNSNTRLGLVSTDLGLPPVPGGQTGGSIINPPGPSGCYCLPVNQACPNQPLPVNTNGANVFDVRIVNRPRPGQSGCSNPRDKICCLSGNSPGNNIPQPLPVHTNPSPINTFPTNPFPTRPFPNRPNPVVPNPVQIGTCGVSNPIPYRQANFAEAQFGEYPWMAVILDLGDAYLGGGVLIARDWVLTAAHKVYTTRSMKVRLGEHDVKNPTDHPQYPHLEVQVDRIVIHPNFNDKSLTNDVALLHLSRPVNTQAYPHIGTACLPEQGQLFQAQSCWVTGWGKDAFEQGGSFQKILKEVDVPIVEPFACQAKLRSSRLGQNFLLDSNSFVCAGGIEGKDACTGDGGAPLVCRGNQGWTVVGLVAWGIGCARSELPGVYVNIPNYANFIRQYTGF